MAWVVSAVVASAVVGGVASYAGAKKQEKASKKAVEATLTATRETNALTEKMYNQGREDQMPWLKAGEKALQDIQDTPDFSFSNSDFFSDPSFKFRMDEGMKTLDNSASARGTLRSGSQQKALMNYGQGMASQEYGNAFNRAKTTYDTNMNTDKSLAGIGQQTAGNLAGQGSNMANSVGNTTMNGVNSVNALNMNNANNQSNMYKDLAGGANQAIGNILVARG